MARGPKDDITYYYDGSTKPMNRLIPSQTFEVYFFDVKSSETNLLQVVQATIGPLRTSNVYSYVHGVEIPIPSQQVMVDLSNVRFPEKRLFRVIPVMRAILHLMSLHGVRGNKNSSIKREYF